MSEQRYKTWIAALDTSDNDGSWEVRGMLDEKRYVLLAYGLTETIARQMAAVPDMLAVLKPLLESYLATFSGNKDQLALDAQAAIAKASGPEDRK